MKKDFCIYCGSTRNLERDHIKPKSKGGKATVIACRACNRSKSNKSLLKWFRYIKKNDKYRWNKIKKFNYRKRNYIAQLVRKVRDED